MRHNYLAISHRLMMLSVLDIHVTVNGIDNRLWLIDDVLSAMTESTLTIKH